MVLSASCAIHNLNLKVSKEKKGKVVDARCRDLTNTVAVNKARADPGSVEVCNLHEVGILLLVFRCTSLKDGLGDHE